MASFYPETVPDHLGCPPQGMDTANTNMINEVVRKKFDPGKAEGIFKRKFEMIKVGGSVPFASCDEYRTHPQRDECAAADAGGGWDVARSPILRPPLHSYPLLPLIVAKIPPRRDAV